MASQQLQLFADEWRFLRHVFGRDDIASVRHVADASCGLQTQVIQIVQASRTLNPRTKAAVALAFGTS